MELGPGVEVFVTGGSGFVGGAVIAALRAQGVGVRALARSPAAEQAVTARGAVAVRGDLASVDAMCAGMQGCAGVIHSAAKVEDWGRAAEFQAINIDGTRNVLAAARAAGVARLVHISTEAVLAGGKPIVQADERTPYPALPNGFYPWSKGQAERDVLGASSAGFDCMAVRPRFIWGRGDTTLLPQLAEVMLKGSWAWFGGGSHLISTCHVRNVVEGTLLALTRGRGGEAYFLTDGAPVQFRDFLTRLVATQNVQAPARVMPLFVAELMAAVGEGIWSAFNLDGRPLMTRTALNLLFSEVTVVDRKARAELGYQALVSIEQGLAELREDFLARAA